MKKQLLIATSITLLASCSGGGPGVSGSADESAGSQTSSTSLWERIKRLSLSEEKTIEMSATGIIADAFNREAANRNVTVDLFQEIILIPRNGERQSMAAVLKDQAAIVSKEIANSPEAHSNLIMDGNHVAYSVPLALATAPRKGWEVQVMDDRKVRPEFDTPFFNKNRKPPTYDPDLHIRYMDMLAISSVYANNVFSEIAAQMAGVTLSDPDEAQKRVLAIFQSIPADKLHAMLLDATRLVESGKYTTDLTGSGNIHFTNNTAGDFVGDARGVVWTKAGGMWFGDGKLNGQNVSFRLASTTSLNQRQAESGSTGTNADAKVNGSSNVGPSR